MKHRYKIVKSETCCALKDNSAFKTHIPLTPGTVPERVAVKDIRFDDVFNISAVASLGWTAPGDTIRGR